jgi:hypothetical protein
MPMLGMAILDGAALAAFNDLSCWLLTADNEF